MNTVSLCHLCLKAQTLSLITRLVHAILLPCYQDSSGVKNKQMPSRPHSSPLKIVRVQTGVRIEAKMLKVLKALAEYLGISLGDLLEGIVTHAFEGKSPFNPETLEKIAALKEIYEMNYGAEASHQFVEDNPEEASR